MLFDLSAGSYDRFMGRYSAPLAGPFADFADVADGQRVLDVGAGTGVLTAELARRVGAAGTAAVEPAERFVAAARERVPGADVRQGPGERLPFPDATFDAALAQLVLAFVEDAPACAAEMVRVVRPGGVVAACMWSVEPNLDMLRAFWVAYREVVGALPTGPDRMLAYRTREELEDLAGTVGLRNVETARLRVEVEYADFDELWDPFGDAPGPTGAAMGRLDADQQAALGEAMRRGLGDPREPFRLSGEAVALRGEVAA